MKLLIVLVSLILGMAACERRHALTEGAALEPGVYDPQNPRKGDKIAPVPVPSSTPPTKDFNR